MFTQFSDEQLISMRAAFLSHMKSCVDVADRRRLESGAHAKALTEHAERMHAHSRALYMAVCAEIDKRPALYFDPAVTP